MKGLVIEVTNGQDPKRGPFHIATLIYTPTAPEDMTPRERHHQAQDDHRVQHKLNRMKAGRQPLYLLK